MFDRIDVTILNVASIIRLIPDEVFPKSPLPDAALATLLAYTPRTLMRRE
jgi:hypothetical protein